MQHTDTTRAIILRLRRTSIPAWLLDDDEREHVETSPEWRLETIGGVRVACLIR